MNFFKKKSLFGKTPNTYNIISICSGPGVWIVLDNYTVWCLDDIRNPNSVWTKLPNSYLKQISCGVRGAILGGVNEENNAYYATENLLTNPTWQDITGKYTYLEVCLPGGTAYAIQTDGVVVVSYNISTGTFQRAFAPENMPNAQSISAHEIGDAGWISIVTTDGDVKTADVWGVWEPTWNLIDTDITQSLYQKHGYVQSVTKYSNVYYSIGAGNDRNFVKIENIQGKLIASAWGDDIIIVTPDNLIYYITPLGDSNATRTLMMNGLPNQKTYPYTYYGNSVPVTKNPYKITLKGQIPVKNWREDVEWVYHGCGYSSKCTTQNHGTRSRWPYSNDGLAIESPSITTMSFWGSQYGSGCGTWKYQAHCWVPKEYLTHVFGYGTPKTIPALNEQYTKISALDLQITPFDKILGYPYDNYDGQLDYDLSSPDKWPIFTSISFNLPDPTENVDIDSDIPYILLNYAADDYGRTLPGITTPGPVITIDVLNDYISKYLFTNVNGIPRISLTDSKLRTAQQKNMYKNLDLVINGWKTKHPDNSYKTSAKKYCAGNNLKSKFCMDVCESGESTVAIDCDNNLQAFCKKGGNGKLPVFTKNGILPTTPVTQKILDDAYPMYSKYPEICGCNMPTAYYQQLDIKAFQEIDDSVANKDVKQLIYSNISNAGGVGGRPACDPATSCHAGGSLPNKADNSQGTCPTIAIQTCLQQASATAGNVKGSSNVGTISQAMQCTQAISTIAPSSPPSSPPGSSNPYGVSNPPSAKTPINAGPVKITETPPNSKTTATNSGGSGSGGATNNTSKTTPNKPDKSKSPKPSAPGPVPPKSNKTLFLVGGGVFLILIIAIVAFLLLHKKK